MRRWFAGLIVVCGLAWAGAACSPAEPCPLCDAVAAGDVARAEAVLQAGAVVDRVSWELAVTALANGDTGAAGLVTLLARHGADPNHTIAVIGEARRGAPSRSGATAVAGIIAGSVSDAALVDVLIANGLDVQRSPGVEALHAAAAAGHTAVVRRLLKAGVPVNAVADGQTALALAIQTRHQPTIEALEAAGGLEW